MLIGAASVVQQLCKSCRTCFMFYCMFYFTCDRSFRPGNLDTPAGVLDRCDTCWTPSWYMIGPWPWVWHACSQTGHIKVLYGAFKYLSSHSLPHRPALPLHCIHYTVRTRTVHTAWCYPGHNQASRATLTDPTYSPAL